MAVVVPMAVETVVATVAKDVVVVATVARDVAAVVDMTVTTSKLSILTRFRWIT